MRPITVSVGPIAAASANNVAQSQTPAAAGALTLNGAAVTGGVATLDVPRRVLITTAADETAKTLTITGTDRNGIAITETLTGPNATTAYTVQDFKRVTAVSVSAAFAGAVTVGTNGVASSRWVFLDPYSVGNPSFQVSVSGTVNWTVETSNDDVVSGAVAPGSTVWFSSSDANLVAQTAAKQGTQVPLPNMVRLTLNSVTGSANMVVTQPSAVPY